MDKQTKLDIIEMGRGYLGVLLLVILMSNGVVAMYAGDSMSFEVDLENPVYTVIGNSSNLEGLNIIFENGNITISPALDYKPDNFTLIFFDNLTREIEKIIYRGGGTRTKYIDKNVTVYVPEYINITEEIEVEKIIEETETIVVEKGYKLWQILLGLALGMFMGWLLFRKEKVDIND